MKLKRVTRASQLKTGDRVRCTINERPIDDCKVYKDISGVFLCHNEPACDGHDCGKTHRMGYSHSWSVPKRVGQTFASQLAYEHVKGLRKLVKEDT